MSDHARKEQIIGCPDAGDIKQPSPGFVNLIELLFVGGVSNLLIRRQNSLKAGFYNHCPEFEALCQTRWTQSSSPWPP